MEWAHVKNPCCSIGSSGRDCAGISVLKEGMVDWKNKDKLEDYIAFISYSSFLLCSYFYVGENSEGELKLIVTTFFT